jgi:protein-L-isoaspartate(D-aspartate) O-methyltransferase
MSDFYTRRVMMVDTQVRPSDVTKFPIIAAMLAVEREAFVPASQHEAAYAGANLPLAANRVVMEARSLAKLLDALDIQPGERVLDLGTGLGYGAAVLAHMGCNVVALDEAAFADQARAALGAAGYAQIKVVSGALDQGAAGEGQFDAILVEGAVEIVPDALVAQLKEGGRIGALFMQGALGTARIGYKEAGQISWRNAFNATAPVLPGFAPRREFVF